MLKSPKTSTLADMLTEGSLSTLDRNSQAQKLSTKKRMVIAGGKEF